jgi:hypothetical protein
MSAGADVDVTMRICSRYRTPRNGSRGSKCVVPGGGRISPYQKYVTCAACRDKARLRKHIPGTITEREAVCFNVVADDSSYFETSILLR